MTSDAVRPLFIEVFAGSGRLADASEKLGWRVEWWDVLLGAEFNLSVAANVRRLLQLVSDAAYVHIGPPCGMSSTSLCGVPGTASIIAPTACLCRLRQL